MARTEISETGINLDKFPYEKAGLTREQVQSVLKKACDNNFDFKITKDLNPVQVYTSLLFYNINKENGRNIFNGDLYYSKKITVAIKRLILEAYEKEGKNFKIPRNVADVYNWCGLQKTYGMLKSKFEKEDLDIDETIMTKHVYYDHYEKEITGGRILQRQKYEASFSEEPKDLVKEVLKANVEKIARWMACPTKQDLVLSYDFKRQIGSGIDFNFCKINCNNSIIVLKKDNVIEPGENISRNANKNSLGFIVKTFYPSVIDAEKTGERIAYKDLQEKFGDVSYVKTPLYRTFAIAKEQLEKNQNCMLNFYVADNGKYTAINANFVLDNGDKISVRISNNHTKCFLKPLDLSVSSKELYLYGEVLNNHKDVFCAVQFMQDCLDQQKKIGIKEFGDKINDNHMQEITYQEAIAQAR